MLFSVLGTAAFLAFCFTIGRRWVARIIRWTNDHFVIEMPVITMILVIMIALALVSDFIGVHTVLGAFVAGIMIGQSPILTKRIEEQLRGLIVALFMPIFFGVAGLAIDLKVLRDPTMLVPRSLCPQDFEVSRRSSSSRGGISFRGIGAGVISMSRTDELGQLHYGGRGW